MYPTSSLVTTITSDRLRAAETARRANAGTTTIAAARPRRSRRLRSLATRIAAPGVR